MKFLVLCFALVSTGSLHARDKIDFGNLIESEKQVQQEIQQEMNPEEFKGGFHDQTQFNNERQGQSWDENVQPLPSESFRN